MTSTSAVPQTASWSSMFGLSSDAFNVANSASSTGFAIARKATQLSLQIAKRFTQGIVALPALAADGALTGSVPGTQSGLPTVSDIAHSTVEGFFDAISFVALAGIDVTNAIAGVGLGAAGSGVEGMRRALGGEVLQSLAKFTRLVRREWSAQDDALPPGGVPTYSVIGMTQALSSWVCIQLVTHPFQVKRMMRSLQEVDVETLKQQLIPLSRETQPKLPLSLPAPEKSPASIENTIPSVRITSQQTLSGDEGNIIGAEIGNKQGSDIERQQTKTEADQDSRCHTAKAIYNMQRYSKLVLGVYGGIAMAWFGALPSDTDNDNDNDASSSHDGNDVLFSAEDEFIARDQADFLEAAAQMELQDCNLADDLQDRQPLGGESGPSTNAPDGRRAMSRSYSFWDLWSGRHDVDLFHRTAKLATGAAQEGIYDDPGSTFHPASDVQTLNKPNPSKPRFYIVTDHPHKKIILVLRGTLTFGDLAADLTCQSVGFVFDVQVAENLARKQTPERVTASNRFFDGLGPDLCHEGMYITAKEIGALGRPVNRSVAQALLANDGYSLDITGHSMGAGIASLLALMWADPSTGLTIPSSGLPQGRRVHAYCFAMPCVTSESLARKATCIVTSFVYSFDFVSRLSLGAVLDIRNACAWLYYEDSETCKRSITRDSLQINPIRMLSLMRLAFAHQAGRLDSDPELKERAESDFLSLRKTLEANMHGTHLFPPGQVLYSLPPEDFLVSSSQQSNQPGLDNKQDRLFVVKDQPGALHDVFGQIIFSRNMLSCHMPTAYDKALHTLFH